MDTKPQFYYRWITLHSLVGGGPRVVVSTAAFHARFRGSVPGLGGSKETKLFLPHPRVKVSIVGSLRDREVACSASDRQGSNFESCVWRTVSYQSSHHPQEVLLAQFSLYVHKGGLKPDSFYLHSLVFSINIAVQKERTHSEINKIGWCGGRHHYCHAEANSSNLFSWKVNSYCCLSLHCGLALEFTWLYSVKRSDVIRWKQGYITPPPPYFILWNAVTSLGENKVIQDSLPHTSLY